MSHRPLWLLLLVVSIIDMMTFRAPPAASYIGFEPMLSLMSRMSRIW
jgi:hypothetical protein